MPRPCLLAASLATVIPFAACDGMGRGVSAGSLPPFAAEASAPLGPAFLDQSLQVVCNAAIDPASITAGGVQPLAAVQVLSRPTAAHTGDPAIGAIR